MAETPSGPTALARNPQARVLVEILQGLQLPPETFQERIREVSKLYRWTKHQEAQCWEVCSRPVLTSQQLFGALSILTKVYLPKHVYRDIFNFYGR